MILKNCDMKNWQIKYVLNLYCTYESTYINHKLSTMYDISKKGTTQNKSTLVVNKVNEYKPICITTQRI